MYLPPTKMQNSSHTSISSGTNHENNNNNHPPLIPQVLPHEQLYILQFGTKQYQLSGASLSYDSPSYFTNYFLNNPNTNKLIIDRSSIIFDKIYLHLQGYSIKINDDFEFIYLLTDSNYFKLNKLMKRLLTEPLHIRIGGELFKIPRDLLTENGNYPNYFTTMLEGTLLDTYNVINNKCIRPPPMTPYSCNRSSKLFNDILYGLSGNQIIIQNENHRNDLIKECKYYQFLKLEQSLIKHQILTNPFTNNEEILINYEDIKVNNLLNESNNENTSIIKYSRPFIDNNKFRDLIIQINSMNVNLMINLTLSFYNLLITGKSAIIMKKILMKITDDYIFEIVNGLEKLTILIEMGESVGLLNNLNMDKGWIDTLISVNKNEENNDNSNIYTNDNDNNSPHKIIIVKLLKSQWTINVQGRNKIWMNCLKFDGVLDKSHYNQRREFI